MVMLKKMLKNDSAVAIAVICLVASLFAVVMFMTMPEIKGLKIHAPDFESISNLFATEKNDNSASMPEGRAFVRFFGLDITRKIEQASQSATVAEVKPLPKAVASASVPIAAPVVAKPLLVDLEKLGYRLKGIALENRRSAAFVFVPVEKRIMVIRENATGSIRLIEASMRSVKLLTPEGVGILALEHATAISGSPPNTSTAAQASKTLPPIHQIPKKEADQPPSFVGASSVAGYINEGQMRVTRHRGQYAVEMRKIPEAFKDYDLQAGDQILGTSAGDFKRSQDVALQLGSIQSRPTGLKIQRGGRTMMLPAPPPKKAPSTPQNAPPSSVTPPKSP